MMMKLIKQIGKVHWTKWLSLYFLFQFIKYFMILLFYSYVVNIAGLPAVDAAFEKIPKRVFFLSYIGLFLEFSIVAVFILWNWNSRKKVK